MSGGDSGIAWGLLLRNLRLLQFQIPVGEIGFRTKRLCAPSYGAGGRDDFTGDP